MQRNGKTIRYDMKTYPSLDEVGLKHGTDKSSDGHNHLTFYGNFFLPLRESGIRILEIGVLRGASVRTWEEYFPMPSL
jgi:hypothetical protein